jgi:20S proteasome alpha/beta subunit
LQKAILPSTELTQQRKDAIDLVARAIRSGIFNDLGSGSNVDVSVITKNGTEMMRNYETPVSRLASRFNPALTATYLPVLDWTEGSELIQ